MGSLFLVDMQHEMVSTSLCKRTGLYLFKLQLKLFKNCFLFICLLGNYRWPSVVMYVKDQGGKKRKHWNKNLKIAWIQCHWFNVPLTELVCDSRGQWRNWFLARFEVEHTSRNDRYVHVVVYKFKLYFLQSYFTYNKHINTLIFNNCELFHY